MCLEGSPECHKQLDMLAELDHPDQSQSDASSGNCSAQADHQDDKQHSNSRNYKVENKSEPALDCEQQVERPLRAIQQDVIFILELLLPTEGSDGDETSE